MKNKVIDFLRIFRAQTYPADLVLILVPYMVAGGELFSLWGLGLSLFAFLVHAIGFGHNSLSDAERIPAVEGYDRTTYDELDPHKEHHPLVDGRISLNDARNLIHTGYAFVFIIGTALAYFSHGSFSKAVLCLFGFFVFAHMYNDGQDKSTILGFVPISVCFSFLSLYGYFLFAQKMTWVAWYLAIYYLLTIFFQIAYEGYLKDIKQTTEKNLLRKLGAEVVEGREVYKPHIVAPLFAFVKLFTLGFIIPFHLLGYIDLLSNDPSLVGMGAIATLAVAILFQLVDEQPYVHSAILRYCGLEEISSLYLPIVIFLTMIGYAQGLVLMTFGVLYFFGMNKVNWKVTYPDV